MNELEQGLPEPFPKTPGEFIRAVRKAHYRLFRYSLPWMAGRFRGPLDEVTFGGQGANKREGSYHRRIAHDLRNAFHLATHPGWDHLQRSAAFLACFFRVHPFVDGNGRVGRLFVRKICRLDNKAIPSWLTTGKGRRKYVSALEYAHRHHLRLPDRGLLYLKNWIGAQVVDAPDEEDLDVR